MTTADLAFGRRCAWRGLPAIIVDIQWRARRTRVQIRVHGGHTHWTTPAELEPPMAGQMNADGLPVSALRREVRR